MEQNPYRNDFACWQDVQDAFGIDLPEPEQVIVADYTYEDYSGDSDVLYRNGDKFFYVSGSHCSCYGLEDQWEPEEYTRETLLGQIERAESEKYGGFFKVEAATIRSAIENGEHLK